MNWCQARTNHVDVPCGCPDQAAIWDAALFIKFAHDLATDVWAETRLCLMCDRWIVKATNEPPNGARKWLY